MYNAQELRQIAAADPQRGWSSIPEDCPPEIRSKIVEYRAQMLGIARDPAVEAAKVRLDSLKATISAA